jgi:hypothetical protein
MGKQVRKVLILTGLVSMTLFGGAMNTYAASTGGGPSQQTAEAKPTTYNQQAVKALGNWEQQGTTWKFRCLDGSYLANSWVESLSEASAFYYVDGTGAMLINSKTPDGYSVDANGLWRTQAVVARAGHKTETSNSSKRTGLYVDENGESQYDATDEEIAMVRAYFQGVSKYDGIH